MVTGLYDRIKALCAENAMDVATLEKTCGFKQGCIHKWNKSAPSAYKLQEVCKVLRIQMEELLNGESA